MKKFSVFLISMFINITFLYSQNNNKFNPPAMISLGAFESNILSQNYYGLNFGFGVQLKPKYSIGFDMNFTEQKNSIPYNYTISKPLLKYTEIGIKNQYTFFNTNYFNLKTYINNELFIASLSDGSILEKYNTKYGYKYRPKIISNNYLFSIEPGLSLNTKLYTEKNKKTTMFLTANCSYRKEIGGSKFGNINDYSNMYYG